ncbi:MAG: NYN domain-containing protein [Candidatus Omnitrophica bacterium]|nr:NYN domain-containing protein [Candidatus Omnitrophota bacterium]
MSRHYIIDGCNVIFNSAFAGYRKHKQPRQALLDFLIAERPCGSLKNKITVVFDGYSSNLNYDQQQITVIFSAHESADERIKKILENKHVLIKQVILVSDDRQIRDFARIIGVEVLAVEDFLQQANRKKQKCVGMECLKPELSHSQMLQINRELRRIWLKE